MGIPASAAHLVLREFKLEEMADQKVLLVSQPDIGFQLLLDTNSLTPAAVIKQLQPFCRTPGAVIHATEATLPWSVAHPPAGSAVVLLFVASDETPPWLDNAAADMMERRLAGSNRFVFVAVHGASQAVLDTCGVSECPGLVVLPGPNTKPVAQLVPVPGTAEVAAFIDQFSFNTKSIVNLTGENIDLFLHRDNKTVKCVLFTSHRNVPKLYTQLWQQHQNKVCFGIVVSPQQDVMDKFGIVDAPGPMIAPVLLTFQGAAFQLYHGALDKPSIGDFLTKMSKK